MAVINQVKQFMQFNRLILSLSMASIFLQFRPLTVKLRSRDISVALSNHQIIKLCANQFYSYIFRQNR